VQMEIEHVKRNDLVYVESSKPCRDKWQVYFRNLGRNIVEIWEMFDFGHVKSHKELKEALQNIIKTADEPTLRLASKLIRAVSR